MKPLTLQSAHDKQSETIQKQAHKIAMLVKQVEANGECHKGLTAKPCHCEAIESAHDKLKQRIQDAPRASTSIEVETLIYDGTIETDKEYALVELEQYETTRT
jgi:hypothetical protein